MVPSASIRQRSQGGCQQAPAEQACARIGRGGAGLTCALAGTSAPQAGSRPPSAPCRKLGSSAGRRGERCGATLAATQALLGQIRNRRPACWAQVLTPWSTQDARHKLRVVCWWGRWYTYHTASNLPLCASPLAPSPGPPDAGQVAGAHNCHHLVAKGGKLAHHIHHVQVALCHQWLDDAGKVLGRARGWKGWGAWGAGGQQPRHSLAMSMQVAAAGHRAYVEFCSRLVRTPKGAVPRQLPRSRPL